MHTATKTRADQWITAARKNFPKATCFRLAPLDDVAGIKAELARRGITNYFALHLGNWSCTITGEQGNRRGAESAEDAKVDMPVAADTGSRA